VTPGEVILGADSRIVMEPRDEAVEVYYLFDVLNAGGGPVATAAPFGFQMPSGALGCSLLEGSSPRASVNGARVSVQGPFPPGSTPVQVGCELPATDGSLEFTQKLPATAQQLSVIVKKVGATKLTSAAIANQQELSADGETYIAGAGPSVAAGQPISFSLENLPRHSRAPRWTALSLAIGIVLTGIWAATRKPRVTASIAAERKRLLAQRNRLFNDLVRVEQDHRIGRGNERLYVARRGELIAALEQVYGALDSDDAGPEPFDGFAV
jgi:hypothetical protein